MIAALASLALRAGVPKRFAKAAGIAALVAVLALLLIVGKCSYDQSVIEKHDAKQDAATAKADRKADAKASTERRADDSRLITETQQLEGARNAPTDVDRRLARHRCLRTQQADRAAGRKSSVCP